MAKISVLVVLGTNKDKCSEDKLEKNICRAMVSALGNLAADVDASIDTMACPFPEPINTVEYGKSISQTLASGCLLRVLFEPTFQHFKNAFNDAVATAVEAGHGSTMALIYSGQVLHSTGDWIILDSVFSWNQLKRWIDCESSTKWQFEISKLPSPPTGVPPYQLCICTPCIGVNTNWPMVSPNGEGMHVMLSKSRKISVQLHMTASVYLNGKPVTSPHPEGAFEGLQLFSKTLSNAYLKHRESFEVQEIPLVIAKSLRNTSPALYILPSGPGGVQSQASGLLVIEGFNVLLGSACAYDKTPVWWELSKYFDRLDVAILSDWSAPSIQCYDFLSKLAGETSSTGYSWLGSLLTPPTKEMENNNALYLSPPTGTGVFGSRQNFLAPSVLISGDRLPERISLFYKINVGNLCIQPLAINIGSLVLWKPANLKAPPLRLLLSASHISSDVNDPFLCLANTLKFLRRVPEVCSQSEGKSTTASSRTPKKSQLMTNSSQSSGSSAKITPSVERSQAERPSTGKVSRPILKQRPTSAVNSEPIRTLSKPRTIPTTIGASRRIPTLSSRVESVPTIPKSTAGSKSETRTESLAKRDNGKIGSTQSKTDSKQPKTIENNTLKKTARLENSVQEKSLHENKPVPSTILTFAKSDQPSNLPPRRKIGEKTMMEELTEIQNSTTSSINMSQPSYISEKTLGTSDTNMADELSLNTLKKKYIPSPTSPVEIINLMNFSPDRKLFDHNLVDIAIDSIPQECDISEKNINGNDIFDIQVTIDQLKEHSLESGNRDDEEENILLENLENLNLKYTGGNYDSSTQEFDDGDKISEKIDKNSVIFTQTTVENIKELSPGITYPDINMKEAPHPVHENANAHSSLEAIPPKEDNDLIQENVVDFCENAVDSLDEGEDLEKCKSSDEYAKAKENLFSTNSANHENDVQDCEPDLRDFDTGIREQILQEDLSQPDDVSVTGDQNTPVKIQDSDSLQNSDEEGGDQKSIESNDLGGNVPLVDKTSEKNISDLGSGLLSTDTKDDNLALLEAQTISDVLSANNTHLSRDMDPDSENIIQKKNSEDVIDASNLEILKSEIDALHHPIISESKECAIFPESHNNDEFPDHVSESIDDTTLDKQSPSQSENEINDKLNAIIFPENVTSGDGNSFHLELKSQSPEDKIIATKEIFPSESILNEDNSQPIISDYFSLESTANRDELIKSKMEFPDIEVARSESDKSSDPAEILPDVSLAENSDHAENQLIEPCLNENENNFIEGKNDQQPIILETIASENPSEWDKPMNTKLEYAEEYLDEHHLEGFNDSLENSQNIDIFETPGYAENKLFEPNRQDSELQSISNEHISLRDSSEKNESMNPHVEYEENVDGDQRKKSADSIVDLPNINLTEFSNQAKENVSGSLLPNAIGEELTDDIHCIKIGSSLIADVAPEENEMKPNINNLDFQNLGQIDNGELSSSPIQLEEPSFHGKKISPASDHWESNFQVHSGLLPVQEDSAIVEDPPEFEISDNDTSANIASTADESGHFSPTAKGAFTSQYEAESSITIGPFSPHHEAESPLTEGAYHPQYEAESIEPSDVGLPSEQTLQGDLSPSSDISHDSVIHLTNHCSSPTNNGLEFTSKLTNNTFTMEDPLLTVTKEFRNSSFENVYTGSPPSDISPNIENPGMYQDSSENIRIDDSTMHNIQPGIPSRQEHDDLNNFDGDISTKYQVQHSNGYSREHYSPQSELFQQEIYSKPVVFQKEVNPNSGSSEEISTAGNTSDVDFMNRALEQKFDPLKDWGSPQYMPAPTVPGTRVLARPQPATSTFKSSRPATAGTTSLARLSTPKSPEVLPPGPPVYLDVIWVPSSIVHVSFETATAFFTQVRARVYILSGECLHPITGEALIAGISKWTDEDRQFVGSSGNSGVSGINIVPTDEPLEWVRWLRTNGGSTIINETGEQRLRAAGFQVLASATLCDIHLSDSASEITCQGSQILI